MQTDERGSHWDGVQYSKNSQVQYDIAMATLREQTLRGDESVLDVGCGDGKITREIAALVPKGSVLGIDISTSMLQTAERGANSNRITFQLKDVQQLDFAQQFDLVTSFFCLQWAPNKLIAFQRIYRSLKPGGCLLAIMPLVHKFAALPNDLAVDPRWQKYFKNYPDPIAVARDAQYDVYAKQAGLNITYCRTEPTPVNFPNIDAACGFLMAVTPHLTRLPTEQEKTAFIRAVVDRYLQDVPLAPDGSCYVDFQCIKLLAHRPE